MGQAAATATRQPAPGSVTGGGWRARLGSVAAVATGLAALPVYLRTLAPSIPTGDSPELIAAACLRGVAHPPGYPLYTLLGHLACALPGGSPAVKVNLLSALLHAATVGLVTLLLYQLLTSTPRSPAEKAGRAGGVRPTPMGGRRARGREPHPPGPSPSTARDSTGRTAESAAVAAAVGGLALGFSESFWHYALVAEVFALNSFFAALLLLLLLAWQRRPERGGLFRAFALGCGLAAANHHTIVLLAPAFLMLLWRGFRHLRLPLGQVVGRYLVPGAALVLVGLLPYAYLPLAAGSDPPINWGDPRTPQTFWQHVVRADYGTFALAVQDRPGGGSRLEHLQFLAEDLVHAFTPLGTGLALVGAWWLGRRRPTAGLALLLAFLASGPVFLAYANPQIAFAAWRSTLERFYILPAIPLAVAIGAGAFQLQVWLRDRLPSAQAASRVAQTVGIGLLALPIGAAAVHFDDVDQSDNHVAQWYGEDLLAPLEPHAVLLLRGDVNSFTLDYLQHVERQRSDVTLVDTEKLKKRVYVQQLRRRYPDLAIPFEVYDGGARTSLRELVNANLPTRPVYVLGGPPDPGLQTGFDAVLAGFAARAVPKGSSPDELSIVRQKLDLFQSYRYPATTYAPTTFEASIAADYGRVAGQVAYVLQTAGRPAEAEPLYRTALHLAPRQPGPYKNLGALLLSRGAASSEVASLWEEYLRLVPNDPQAADLRRQLEVWRSGR